MSAVVASSRQMNSSHPSHASDRAMPGRGSAPVQHEGRRNPDSPSRSRPDDAAPRGGDRRAPNNRAPNRERPAAQRASRSPSPARGQAQRSAEKADHPILFQQFFKSVGPRTYAAQVKQATNGNHYIVFTEGRRDDKSGEVRKTRINIFSEDFDAFFDLLRQAAQYVKAHPLPPEFVAKRKKMWASIAKKKSRSGGKAVTVPDTAAHAAARQHAGGTENTRLTQSGKPDAGLTRSDGDERLRDAAGPIRSQDQRRTSGPRQEPPATPARPRAARPLPSARAAAGV